VWSIRAAEAKQVEGCDSIYWLTTNDSASHFWTQVAGVQQFSVNQDELPVITCQAAPPNSQDSPTTCDFFIGTDTGGADTASYLYVAYTPESFAIVNVSSDDWMPLNRAQVFTSSADFRLSDLFVDLDTLADINRLAPSQCFVLGEGEAPEDCDVMGQLPGTSAFWNEAFTIVPTRRGADGVTCPAAVEDTVLICVMPT
jgi:hypothetical protein